MTSTTSSDASPTFTTASTSSPILFNFPLINLVNFVLHFTIILGYVFFGIISNFGFSFLDIIFDRVLHVFILGFFFVDVNLSFPLHVTVIVILGFSFFGIINLVLHVIVTLRLSFLDIVFKLLYTIVLSKF
ncbi:hypothetical protein CaCOL14_002095 [Colletotrichum acutatum]